MEASLVYILVAIFGTGIALAGLILPDLRSMKRDIADLRERVTKLEVELRERMAQLEVDLGERMARLEADMRERMARLEGLFEGYIRRENNPDDTH